VETFEQRYARFPGLNLTFEVREGIAKHSRDFEPGEFPELDEYLPGLRPPLEAQLIDLADEIAYNTADLDDGFSAGMFSLNEVIEQVPHFAEIYDPVEMQFAGATDRVRFLEALRGLINWLVSGFIEGTAAAATDSSVASVEDVRRFPRRLAQLSPEPHETNAALKEFLRKHVYYSDVLVAERARAASTVADLFEFFMTHPERLPETYEEPGAPLHRVVCDFIAGMTDGYFRRVYAQVIG
jgi:dGTPase